MEHVTPFPPPRLRQSRRPLPARPAPPQDGAEQGDSALLDRLLRLAPPQSAAPLRALARTAARERCGGLLAALRATPLVPEALLLTALSQQSGLPVLHQLPARADPEGLALAGLGPCLELTLLPIGRAGEALHFAVEDPAAATRAGRLPGLSQRRCVFSLAPRDALRGALAAVAAAPLLRAAEAGPPLQQSLRGLHQALPPGAPLALLAALLTGLVLAPQLLTLVLLLWITLALLASGLLRGAALFRSLRRGLLQRQPQPVPLRLPVISLLVPLYHEPDITPRLIRRLEALHYPRSALDVILLLEDHDQDTRAALATANLPGWMRVITVPPGHVTTKPRAMNYGLNFARGSLIGIYDAEDEPDRDQLTEVAARFATAPADLACLQGALDYYNPRSNLLARLFTAEYAAWFRVMMPALQALRFPMPLGGTTLFIRREHLAQLGGWDAFNVTEDADLGVRLARAGLRVEMMPMTTHEEANCRLSPWLRQRSRWIKGHMLTWAVHMRSPRALWRDLGPRGFIGYQIVFLGAQSQVLLAPFNWSFWLLLAGMPHPARDLLSGPALAFLTCLFLLSEILLMATATLALRGTRHPDLWRVTALFQMYHLLAALAGWRALYEAFRNPFYWAKTSHGHFDSDAPPAEAPGSTAPPAPVPPATAPAATAPQLAPGSGAAAGLTRLPPKLQITPHQDQGPLPGPLPAAPRPVPQLFGRARDSAP